MDFKTFMDFKQLSQTEGLHLRKETITSLMLEKVLWQRLALWAAITYEQLFETAFDRESNAGKLAKLATTLH